MTTRRPSWTDAEPDEVAFAAVLGSPPGAGGRAGAQARGFCPSPDLLRASREGTLPASVGERVANHLAGCTTCQALLEAFEDPSIDFFVEAARRLTEVTRNHPRSAAAHLYLGVSLLFLQRNPEARTALGVAERLAAKEPGLAAEASWYLALASLRAGERDAALAGLASLCNGGEQARACAGLKELTVAGPGPAAR